MFFKFVCAVVTRSIFILISLIGVWRVVWVKDNGLYWLLTVLYLPLVVEMILTLRRRGGKDYKWYTWQHPPTMQVACLQDFNCACLVCRFSPAIFFFLISIIPSIWILELHYLENLLTDSAVSLKHVPPNEPTATIILRLLRLHTLCLLSLQCEKLSSTQNLTKFFQELGNKRHSELFKVGRSESFEMYIHLFRGHI